MSIYNTNLLLDRTQIYSEKIAARTGSNVKYMETIVKKYKFDDNHSATVSRLEV